MGPPTVRAEHPHPPAWTDDAPIQIKDRLRWARARLEPKLEQRFIDGAADPAASKVLAEAGFLGLTLPARYAGLGQDYRCLGDMCASLGRLDLSFQITVTVHLALTAMSVLQWGTDRQRTRWLPSLASGAEIATFALTEPGAGSDVAAIRTRATACAGGFVLNGEKTWISGANDSSLLLVFATIDPTLRHRGITAFLVARDAAGVSTPVLSGKLGIRAGDTGGVVLNNVVVPSEHLLGEVGEGFAIALSALGNGLFTVGYGALGIIRECLSLVTTLVQGDDRSRRSAADQSVRATIAAMVADEASARVLLDHAAELKNRGLPSQQATSLAKWTAARGADRVATSALQIAQVSQSPSLATFERHLQNAKGATIYGGTTEIHQVMQAAYATGDRLDYPPRRPPLTAAELASEPRNDPSHGN
ncbi:MAG: acyl-CoA dehydrogenase family protein [Chloroflexota bacterium]|nr:acyl-CoA dehydrogenase family protein [Chloroflexota bacterium]